MVQETITIKLVADPDNERAAFFKELISKREELKLIGEIDIKISKKAKYHIFFDLSGFEKKPEDLLAHIAQLSGNKYTIYDVDTHLFSVGSYQVLATVSASFATCGSAELQEQVYENTGRLAPIIDWPKYKELQFELPDLKNNSTSPQVVWYGSKEEIFSIRPYTIKNKIELLFNDTGVSSTKTFNKKIGNADIIFLPKCFTDQAEEDRQNKVDWCISKGKFVAAPNLSQDSDNMAFDFDLEQAIEFYKTLPQTELEQDILEAQDKLKKAHSYDQYADQLLNAIRATPNDDFMKDIGDFLKGESNTY